MRAIILLLLQDFFTYFLWKKYQKRSKDYMRAIILLYDFYFLWKSLKDYMQRSSFYFCIYFFLSLYGDFFKFLVVRYLNENWEQNLRYPKLILTKVNKLSGVPLLCLCFLSLNVFLSKAFCKLSIKPPLLPMLSGIASKEKTFCIAPYIE